jgi:ABC-type antimicrobial peptide transport system permease subunit
MVGGCTSIFMSMVESRRREIAIRMSLGATQQSELLRFAARGIATCLPGVLVGLLLAFAAMRIAPAQLPTDLVGVWVWAVVPASVLIVAIGAAVYATAVALRPHQAAQMSLR